MSENLVNNFSTTLVAAIDDVQTVIEVTAQAPAEANFRIKIGAELMLVTDNSTLTWTVVRGAESTTAAEHAAQSVLVAVLTADGLNAWLASHGVPASSVALSSVTAAVAPNSILNGQFERLWEWALTAPGVGLSLRESSPSSGGGASDQAILQIDTETGSTAYPLLVQIGGSNKFLVNNFGNVGVGVTGAEDRKIAIGGTYPEDAGISRGIYIGGTISAATDTLWEGILIGPTIADAVAIQSLAYLRIFDATLGAGSTVDNQYGLLIEEMDNGTNNYAIRVQNQAGSGVRNFYADGDADNYLAGSLLLGNGTTDGVIKGFSGRDLQINGQRSSTGGGVFITGGSGGTTGIVLITGGTGASGAAGANVAMQGGPGLGAGGTGGQATVRGGLPADGDGGAVTLAGREGVGTNRSGGSANVTAGAGTGVGAGGDVVLTPGLTGGGQRGRVNIVNAVNGAAAQTATITNGPTAGNPTIWLQIKIDGAVRYIPAWS